MSNGDIHFVYPDLVCFYQFFGRGERLKNWEDIRYEEAKKLEWSSMIR